MQYREERHLLLRQILAIPFVLSVFFPLVIVDIWVEIYHRVAFRLCRMPYVKRSNYIRIDRQKLSKLTPLEKLGCIYCGYANGWMNYGREIAARTEVYWCGIKHEQGKGFVEPIHHQDFADRSKYE